jgi:hypothetical protein
LEQVQRRSQVPRIQIVFILDQLPEASDLSRPSLRDNRKIKGEILSARLTGESDQTFRGNTMNTIRITKTGFIAKGTARDFPRFADLAPFMEMPKSRFEWREAFGVSLAIAALCVAGMALLVIS